MTLKILSITLPYNVSVQLIESQDDTYTINYFKSRITVYTFQPVSLKLSCSFINL